MKKFLFTVLILSSSIMAFAQIGSSSSSDVQERYASVFNSLDRDQDERLSTAEASAAGISDTRFQSLDKESDGYLTLEEFLAMVIGEQ